MMMALYITVWLLLIAGPPAILIWAVRQWRRSANDPLPAWRRHFAMGAIVLLAWSDLLWIVSGVWTDISGGIAYDPVPKGLGTLGLFAAPVGLLASLIGKGTPRWPACSVSIALMLVWIASSLSV